MVGKMSSSRIWMELSMRIDWVVLKGESSLNLVQNVLVKLGEMVGQKFLR